MRPLTDETPAYYRKHAESRWATISFSVFTKDRQAKKSHIPYLTFGESRFPGSSQIPNPVKIFCVFPNPAPFLGQIPDPVKTLPDPVVRASVRSNQFLSKSTLKANETFQKEEEKRKKRLASIRISYFDRSMEKGEVSRYNIVARSI